MPHLIPLEHPGIILKEEFIEALGVTPYAVAKAIGISQTALGEILNGKRNISAITGLKLAKYFSVSDRYFINLQTQYNVDLARQNSKDKIDHIKPLRKTAPLVDEILEA